MKKRKLSMWERSFKILIYSFFRVSNGSKSRVKSFAKAFASFTGKLPITMLRLLPKLIKTQSMGHNVAHLTMTASTVRN